MANYTRTHIHIFPNPEVSQSVEDFEALREILEEAEDEGNLDGLCEAFELDPDSDYVYFDWNCIEDNVDSIELGVFSKGFFPIFNLTEAIQDNYIVSVDLAWCDEDERYLEVPAEDWRETREYDFDTWFNDSGRVGAYSNHVAGYDEENEEVYFEIDQKNYNDKPNKHVFYFPRTPEMEHEVFVMAWDGWRPPSGCDDNFFNQRGLDEKDILDAEGNTIPFEEWIARVYTD